MKRGEITVEGGINLVYTLESGQTYTWNKNEGELFDLEPGSRYSTVTPENGFLEIWQEEQSSVSWKADFDAENYLKKTLGLGDNLEKIYSRSPDIKILNELIQKFSGLRITREPFFRTLISFILSSRMRVERVHDVQNSLRQKFGERVEVQGEEIYTYPEPEKMAEASEQEIKDCGAGYRSSYIQKTCQRFLETGNPVDKDLGIEENRERLKEFTGVGDKVADCILLFSQGFLGAVPLDTWIRKVIKNELPECEKQSYRETSQAIREKFGQRYAGYYQTHIFHYMRTRKN